MSKLLKEAIADAKAVRETALANARLALEEAFAPKLQSMLTKRLKEDDLEDELGDEEVADDELEDELADEEAPEDVAEEGDEEEAFDEEPAAEDDVADEEELDLGDEEEEAVAEDEGELDLDAEEAPEEDELDDEGEEDPLDLENIIKELEADLAIDDNDEVSLEEDDEEEVDDSEEELDIDDVVADDEEEEVEETTEVEETPEEETAELDEDEEIDLEIVEEDEVEESEEEVAEAGETEEVADLEEDDSDEEEINLEEILKELEDETSLEEEELESTTKISELTSTNEKLQKENEEYRKVYKFLRGKLNEVNLLNAKLLYTNKLFKEFALRETQKLKVVESFDLTKNVREAKLVYATLGESFRTTVESKSEKDETYEEVETTPKQTLSKTKKTITEGMASKAIKSTKPSKKILSEGNEFADRFKKLAGIV